MKTKIVCLLAVGVTLLGLAVGCGSLNSATFNSEQLAVDTATQSTHSFNQYYQAATNGASTNDLARLNDYRDRIYSADKDLAKALSVLDTARLDYVANAADTNKTAVAVAAQTVSDQSSNIVWLVKPFTGGK